LKLALVLAVAAGTLLAGSALASPGPVALPATPLITEPRDAPFAGALTLAVDATDTDRRIVRVRETVPTLAAGGDVVLLYPEWLPGTHAPEGTIDKLAGLEIHGGGARLDWKRDVANPFAFHITVPKGVTSLEVSFQYLSPVSEKVGATEISSTIAALEWNALVLYPAGFYARDIPVDAALTLPAGWSLATALERDGEGGPTAHFKRTPLETLIDSPVYAGKYFARFDLDPGGAAPVHLNVFADKASELEVKPEQLAAHRALVQQAYKLYGSRHYDHYDFLFSISDLTLQQGLEHHRSSEDGVGAGYFAKPEDAQYDRALFPHEYTHSWNGKFRRPADLWTPNYNVRMRNSLLWVYEGQTEYWGEVLSARSGLRTLAEEHDSIALTAAVYGDVPGASWRPMQDTTNDEIINPRRPISWGSWQRFEDYYNVGELIWLDADTLIRDRSKGQRSLDDFAKSFFGINSGSYTPVTYTFDELVKALNAVEPYDWAGFLHSRVDSLGKGAPLDGLQRGGYRLVFDDKPNVLLKSLEAVRKSKDFTFSLGVAVGKEGVLTNVKWDSPAFKAGLTGGMTMIAVNGLPYSDELMADELKASKTSSTPMQLIVKTADRIKVVTVDYHGGLRYPHLERIEGSPARLDDILMARK
jgi:predicted metalloprotease with PDZ domain